MERNIVVLVQDFAIEYAQEALDGIYDYLKDKDVNLIISQIRLPDFSTGYYEYQYFASTQILKAKDRTKAGICAPACGLYLRDVYY